MPHHGLSKHPMYSLWFGMKGRCENKKDRGYHRYGARGIKVRWKSVAESFNDMRPSYEAHVKKHGRDNTSLDRIDNDGDYSAKNCHWTTWKKQARNRCDNVIIKYRRESKTLRDWANDFNLHPSTLWRRLNVMKLPMETALLPSGYKKRKSNSKSGFMGVVSRPSGNYQASIRWKDERKILGTFKTAREAAEAYDKEAKKLHGEHAYQNSYGKI